MENILMEMLKKIKDKAWVGKYQQYELKDSEIVKLEDIEEIFAEHLNKQNFKCTLEDCPIGLFEYDGVICLKTKYGVDEIYTVDGGKIFSFDGIAREDKLKVMVKPTTIDKIKIEAKTQLADSIKARFDSKPIGISCIEVKDIWDAINETLLEEK